MLSKQEIINIAKNAALEQNWVWIEPISVERSWESFFRNWNIRTNANKKGRNINIIIDGKNGTIIKKKFSSR